MAWLRTGVSARRLIINDAKALVHTVDGTVYLVSPGVFQRYVQEHPHIAALARQENIADWQWVQAFREAATASQAGQRPEHLDLRSHRATQDQATAWLLDQGAGLPV